MKTSREIVIDTIKFNNPERFPFDLSEKYGSDFYYINMQPSVDDRHDKGIDEWGCKWDNIGVCSLGEVKEFPIKEWSNFNKMQIPDITLSDRWKNIENAKNKANGKFIMGFGISLFERIHFLRGLQNTWLDIYDSPKELSKILDILTDMNIYAIKKYAAAGADGYMFCDDWGFQDKLMISPEKWREIWKPRYKKVYDTAHKYGLYTFLHSCGYILEILDDLAEVGLDAGLLHEPKNVTNELNLI
jgi:uroporphyrinogen decarboxylase